MKSQYVLAAALLVGLLFGTVGDANAVGSCAQVCSGPNEPCSLNCSLPGNFVTTCGDVGGRCVNFATAPVDALFPTLATSCEAGQSSIGAQSGNVESLVESLVTWLHDVAIRTSAMRA